MLINGTADPINPYQGGIVRLFGFASRGTVMSSIASAQNLAERNGIVSPPVRSQLSNGISNDPTFVETLTWNTEGRASFCLYTVRGGGHVVPQQAYRFPRLLGNTSSALNAPREAIRFFNTISSFEETPGLSPFGCEVRSINNAQHDLQMLSAHCPFSASNFLKYPSAA